MDTNTKTTKRSRVSNEQLGAKLDTLIELLIAQAQANVPTVVQEPAKYEPTMMSVPREELQNTAKKPWSDKYADVQGRAMAQYAAAKQVRYYMFPALNKAGQVKLRFYSENNVRKYGTDPSTAVAYCDPGKATVWK